MQNTLVQLNIFSTQELSDLTLSHSDRLAKISALQEREKGWAEIEAPLSSTHFPQYLTSDQMFLSGKTLRALSPQMGDEISSQFYKPLPTLGFMSASGNLLIHRGFSPKIESGFTLLGILQHPSEIGKVYFLSEKMISILLKREEENYFPPQICSTITNKVGNRSSDTYIVNRDKARCLTGGGHSGGLHSDMDYVIQVNSATKNGYEEASKGDSINLQFPNSKTRRGRVGKSVAQTLDCNCNQGVFLSEPTHKHGEERVYTNTAPTIQSRYGTGGDNIPYVNNIRRLTEIECERLQGFPDDWTKLGNYDGEVKQISKTQRYKMCGNAVTAKMVELIGSRIIKNFK